MHVYKKTIMVILIPIILAIFVSCSEKPKTSEDDSTVNGGYQGLVTPPEFTETETEVTTAVTQKEYLAADDNSISEKDTETIKELCSDVLKEYSRARACKDNVNLEPFIESPALIEYTQYRMKQTGHPEYYEIEISSEIIIHTNCAYANNSVEITTKGPNPGITVEGAEFLVKNSNGKLVIAEWYHDGLMSPDIDFGRSFSVENNLNFWDEPSKYEPVLEKIRSFS